MLVRFRFRPSDLDRLAELEDKLRAALASTSAGEYDGNELAVDGSEQGTLYMYGPNADRLFDVVAPILKASQLMTDATAIKRYGPPSETTKEMRVELDASSGP